MLLGKLSGVRERILLIFALALMPVAAATLYVVKATERREKEIAYTQVARWARMLAGEHTQRMQNTRLLLSMLAHTPELQRGDSAGCRVLVSRLKDTNREYRNLGAIELDGRLSCSAMPGRTSSLADRSYFRDALARGDLAGGAFLISRMSGQPAIVYGYPVVTRDSSRARVVFATLDLDWLSDWARLLSLPEGSSILLVDTADIIVYRYPDGAKWMGQVLTRQSMLAAIHGGVRGGKAEGLGLDGVRRLYASTVVPGLSASVSLHALVGVPESRALALTHQLGNRAPLFLIFSLATVLGIAWLLSDRFLLRPVQALSRATERLARGDLGARTGIAGGSDELSRLALAFDGMAGTLQQSHEQLQRNERDNRFLAEASDLLATSTNYHDTLRRVAELAVARFADWCSINLRMGENGAAPFTYVYHADPRRRELAATLAQRYPEDPHDPTNPANEVVRSGQAVLIPRISAEQLEAGARDEEHAVLLRSLGLCSVLIVPLKVSSVTVGTLMLVSAEAAREFTEADLQLAEELGRRTSLAVAKARLYVELEESVRLRTSELQSVNRELETFSYSVSHDLRSPLRSMAGFSQALEEDYAPALDATGRDYLQRIRGGAQRMGRLIDDLLSLSRVARFEMTRITVDVTEMAQSVIRELSQSAPERTIDTVVASNLSAHADPGLLRIVLENLIGNAWKFTAGAVQPRIEIGCNSQAGESVFHVRDNGAGFDMAYADKLFGPFQRLHAMTEFAGTGIGLATVQRIIARHGGRIWADAAVGKGATFYFTLEEPHARHDSTG